MNRNKKGYFTSTYPSASVEVQVIVVSRAAGVLAEEASLVGLVDGLLENHSLVEVLAANIDVALSVRDGREYDTVWDDMG